MGKWQKVRGFVHTMRPTLISTYFFLILLISTLLSDQFKSVFTREDSNPTAAKIPCTAFPSLPPIVVEETGVIKLLAAINPKKASGPDEIPARRLQQLATEISPAFTAFFQQSLDDGSIPAAGQWKKAWITPVFKKGSRSDAVNYRRVSLTSIASKLLEHIFCSHFHKHSDTYNILHEANHGFRAKHSTESQLLLTSHDMLKHWDQGKLMDVIILDFSKAFDKVPHKKLLRKLDHYGVRGNLLRWVEGFLLERHQSVLVDGVKSREEPVLSLPTSCQ